TLFVPGALPGEVVDVRVAAVERRHGRAELVRVVRPSPERVAAPCPVFDACGGCRLQHLAYPAQLAAKRRQVEAALARAGLAGVPVRPPRGMADPWRYRHKIQTPFGRQDGGVVAGFF